MVDIVVNHFAWPGDGTTVDYSKLNPFNSEKYFHPYELLSDASPDNFTAAQVVSSAYHASFGVRLTILELAW
jgi:alpha-amylase